MQFDSFQDFLHMGGYGFYVWLSFGVSALAMLAIVVDSILAKTRVHEALKAQQARAERIRKSKNQSKEVEEQP